MSELRKVNEQSEIRVKNHVIKVNLALNTILATNCNYTWLHAVLQSTYV